MKYKSWGAISNSKRLYFLRSLCHKSLHFLLSFVIIFQSTVSFPQVQESDLQSSTSTATEEGTPQSVFLPAPIEHYDASVPLVVNPGSFSVAPQVTINSDSVSLAPKTYLSPPIAGEDYIEQTKLGYSISKLQNPEFIRETIYELHNALIEKIKGIEIEQGEKAAEYFRRVAGTKATPKITENVGTAELSRIDGKFLVRVVHYQTDTVFYILDEADFSEDNYYLRQLQARQHLMGGTSRLDHQRGRDVIFLWKDGLKNTRTVVSPRTELDTKDPNQHILPIFQNPETFQQARREHRRLRRQERRHAISNKFTMDNITFASVAGIIQGLVTFAMGLSKEFVFGESIELIDIWEIATLSFAFTFFMHLFSGSFRYWINMGKVGLLQRKPIVNESTGFLEQFKAIDWKATFTSKIARNALISITYAYLFLFMTNEQIASLDINIDNIPIFFNLFLWAQLIALPNFIINNSSKTWWTEQAHINEIAGRTNKDISLLGLKLDAASFDFAVVKYNISQVTKLAHLLEIGLVASTSSVGTVLNRVGFNLGLVGMLASIVLGKYFLLKKVFNLNHEGSLENEQLWHYTELVNKNRLGEQLFNVESLRRKFLIWWHEFHIEHPALMNDFYNIFDIVLGRETNYQEANHNREEMRFEKRDRHRRILSRVQNEIEFYRDRRQVRQSLRDVQLGFLEFLNQRHTQILAPAVRRQIMISFDNFAKAVHALFETVNVSHTFNQKDSITPWSQNSDDQNIWDRNRTIEQEDILNFFEEHLTERFPHLKQALSFLEIEDRDSIEVEGTVNLEDMLKENQAFMEEHFAELAQYIEEQEMKNLRYSSGNIVHTGQTSKRNFNYSFRKRVASPAGTSLSNDAVCAGALNVDQ